MDIHTTGQLCDKVHRFLFRVKHLFYSLGLITEGIIILLLVRLSSMLQVHLKSRSLCVTLFVSEIE